MQGTLESGNDPVEVARIAVEAAREMAPELGITEDEATGAVAEGILSAAGMADAEVLAAVRQSLPNDAA